MSDDYSTRFSRLGNAGNYPEWSVRMEAVLVKKGLWVVVEILVSKFKADGAEKSEEELKRERDGLIARRDVGKMAEARAEMILRVEDGQLSHMMSRDPMVIWENLRLMHQAAGFATSLALRRKFLTAKKEDDETMEAWIGRIQRMVLRMEHAEVAVTDQDKILAFTMGLPPTYNPVIINFDATSPEQLTVEHVISRLLNEEARQSSTPSVTTTVSVPSTTELDEAMAVIAARRAAADITCFFCDKKGHFKSDCPEKHAWESAKRKKIGTAAMAIGLDESDSESEAL